MKTVMTAIESIMTGNNYLMLKFGRCNSNCILEATGFTCTTTLGAKSDCTEDCGDGYNFKKLVVVGTACDDGDNVSGDGCSASCVVETGYTCSGGSRTSPDTCREVCGDGYNFDTIGTGQPGDPCDDGAKLNNDGCDYRCLVEDGIYYLFNNINLRLVL